MDFYTSPDGKNTIVVYEDGFITASYHAYPVKYKLFFQQNNIELVYQHGFWGGANKRVVWEEDQAIVYIIFDEYDVNGTKEIIVPLN